MCPIFDGSNLSYLTRHPKIFSGGSLECKNLLKSIWLTMKFHHCHHANGWARKDIRTTEAIVYVYFSTPSLMVHKRNIRWETQGGFHRRKESHEIICQTTTMSGIKRNLLFLPFICQSTLNPTWWKIKFISYTRTEDKQWHEKSLCRM